MRIGTVPYANAYPITFGLECESYREVPGKLIERAGPDDILLAPIVEAFQNPGWTLIEGVGIGSFGPVQTVKLLFKKQNITIENVKSIYLDAESKTSQALLKILLGNFYQRSLASIRFVQQADQAEAALWIGDKIWDLDGPRSLDLGAAWTQWTKLPFVYACWMSRSKATALEWKQILIDQAQENLGRLEALAAQAPPTRCPDLLAYWRRLKYDLDDESKKGITLFQKYWCELESKPRLTLNWL